MCTYLRVSEVVNKTGVAKSTIWLWVKENKFPKPIKLSPRITVWAEDKIEEWIESKF
ncbi:MAG: AlpA family phage regulatory protein [Campylobacteraceae bacterium]|nr:AlpA family phage regulatory protein [Campylobacteraceae bacterium]NQY53810.1 AlpA family phage regulatory protein [Campylobacteraceae bacterium]